MCSGAIKVKGIAMDKYDRNIRENTLDLDVDRVNCMRHRHTYTK